MSQGDNFAKARAAKVAQKKAADERLAGIEATLGKLAASIEALSQQKPAPQAMRMAPKEADLYAEAIKQLTKPGQMVDRSRTMDLLNPRAHLEGKFAEDDVVRLRADSDMAKRIKKSKHYHGEPDEPILGRVMRFMQTDGQGVKKYKVDFRGVGKDGCRETELELVKSAV